MTYSHYLFIFLFIYAVEKGRGEEPREIFLAVPSDLFPGNPGYVDFIRI